MACSLSCITEWVKLEVYQLLSFKKYPPLFIYFFEFLELRGRSAVTLTWRVIVRTCVENLLTHLTPTPSSFQTPVMATPTVAQSLPQGVSPLSHITELARRIQTETSEEEIKLYCCRNVKALCCKVAEHDPWGARERWKVKGRR